MRAPLTLISLLALAWLLVVLLRYPARLPAELVGYFASHFAFVAVSWWALQSLERTDLSYLKIYFLPLAPALAFALLYTVRACSSGPGQLAFGGALLHGWAIGVVIAWTLVRERGPLYFSLPSGLLLLESAIFFACGAALLVSLAADWPPAEFILRLGLGLFWLTQSIFHFSHVAGLAHNRLAWIAHSGWVPTLMAILLFSWMAIALSRQQAELSRAPAHATAVPQEAAE